jgi:hypothetical protein
MAQTMPVIFDNNQAQKTKKKKKQKGVKKDELVLIENYY